MDQQTLSSAADKLNGINYNWDTFSFGIPSSDNVSDFSSVDGHDHMIQVKRFFERKIINY